MHGLPSTSIWDGRAWGTPDRFELHLISSLSSASLFSSFYFLKCQDKNSSWFIPTRCEMLWGARTHRSTCEMTKSAFLSEARQAWNQALTCATLNSWRTSKSLKLQMLISDGKGMKWKRKIQYMYIFFCFPFLKQTWWAAGTPAGESILTASSCTVATEGAELTSGSRGHQRRASPVAQIKRERPGGYLIGMLPPPPHWWGNMSSTQSFLK